MFWRKDKNTESDAFFARDLSCEIREEFSCELAKDIFSVYQLDISLMPPNAGFHPWEVEGLLWKKLKSFQNKTQAEAFSKKASGKRCV